MLLAEGIQIERTHDLIFLIDKYEKETGKTVDNNIKIFCSRLIDYSVKTRYPGEIPLDKNMTSTAISDMKKSVSWIDTQIKELDKTEHEKDCNKPESDKTNSIER